MTATRALVWSNASLLVTGGTGRFGQAFVRAILDSTKPRKVIVFSRDELKQHEMRLALDHPSLRYFIGDVRDRDRLHRVMADVDVVVHSAALTQAEWTEANPFETIQTNVVGVQNIIDAAIDRGVQRVLALSCETAVNPVNLYGATKLCAEKMFVQGNVYSGAGGTRFACCRCLPFGTPPPLAGAGRRPSTDPDRPDPKSSRFWLRQAESVAFVRRCLDRMRGGEIFVPKAPSVYVADLAAALGVDDLRAVAPDARPAEILVSEDEARHALELADMFVIEPAYPIGVPRWTEGTAVPEGFRYASDINERWLTAADLGGRE